MDRLRQLVRDMASRQSELESRNDTLQKDLLACRTHMERVVKERTAELEETNAQLRDEVARRRETQEALLKTAEEIQDIYDNAPCGYHSLDKDGIFLKINETELKWLGYKREELLGRVSFTDIITPASRETFRREFPGFKERGWVSDLEFDMIRKDGTILPILLNATAIRDQAGNYVMSRSTLFDNSARKRTEEENSRLELQLIQAQKMEAIGRFAGGIAHDLNNMIYPVILDIEMLLQEEDAGTEAYERLVNILNTAHREKDLVKQILSFSRRTDQKFGKINLAPLVDETLKLMRASLPSTIEVTQHIDAPEDEIIGDPTQIQQVIVNLCRNAADAMGSQIGLIEVGLTDAVLGPDQAHPGIKPGKYLRLTVRDTGQGMSSQVMDRMFEPFFTTKESGKASGMGLSIVHGILKNHSGHIAAESDPGKGTVFSVYLPLHEEKAEKKGPSEAGKPLKKEKKKILLVDDEEIILSSLERILQRSDYDVVTARDGEKALDLFSRNPDDYDLVITDLTMPRMSGLVLSRKVLDMHPATPVILCTGFNDIISEQEAKAMGVRSLLLKPASISELKTAVHQAIGG